MDIEIDNDQLDDINTQTVIRVKNGQNIRFIKRHHSIIFPTRPTSQSAGFDLYSPMRITLAPFERFTEIRALF